MWSSLLIAFLCWIPGGDSEPAPDRITTLDGRHFDGVVVHEDAERLVLRVKSRDREFEKQDVEQVRAALRELPRALERIEALDPKKIAETVALAQELERVNLLREARLLYWSVLAANPAHEAANLALGHRKRQKSWVIPHNGRWYKLDQLNELCRDWGDAWELDTTHYELRTNLPLAEAVTIAFDLERFYFGFYALFGPGLRLYQVTEPMEVHIHADQASYPGGPRKGFYTPVEARLYLNASSGFRRATLVHEGTHALVDFTARRARPGKGKIPGWLNEGLAVYMETCCGGAPGKLEVVPGTVDRGRFSTHASEKKPYGLNRVLNFQSDDFMASTKTHLKYAQSYTLVHFCLHAGEGRYVPGFFEFLRGAWEGKSSSTHFKKAIGSKEKALEAEWTEYVRGALSKR